MLEGWSTLTALSTLVPRIQVGTSCSAIPIPPGGVAKMAAQVDIISAGGFLLGLGAGWQENEHEAYGIPFYTMRERLERLDEACQVMKSLWTENRSTFKGRYYTLSDAPLQPKAVQKPHPELMIGGGGEKVTLLTVAATPSLNVWGGPRCWPTRAASSTSTAQRRARSQDHPPLGNMSLLITDKKAEADALAETIGTRMGRHARTPRDTCLPALPSRSGPRWPRLRAAKVDNPVIPTLFRPLPELRRDLDRFIAEIAPAFR